MAEVLTDSGRWTVSARSNGEVLTVRAGQPGVQMGFVGCPRGLQASEIQGWLNELAGMAAAAAEAATAATSGAAPLPIPRSLHQALTGLLFLQAEVWREPPERVPLTLVVVEAVDCVALGWSGSGGLTVSRAGRPLEPAWTVVRDDQGREAYAMVAAADAALEVRATWNAGSASGEPEGVLEAEWAGRAPEEAGEAAAPPSTAEAAEFPETPAPSAPEARLEAQAASEREVAPGIAPESEVEPIGADAGEPDPEPRRAVRSRPFWHFRGWMDRLAGATPRRRSEAGSASGPQGVPEPPALEEPIAALPLDEPEPIAHDVPGVPDLIPEPEATMDVATAPQPPAPVAIEPEVPEVPVAIEPEVPGAPVAIGAEVNEAPVAIEPEVHEAPVAIEPEPPVVEAFAPAAERTEPVAAPVAALSSPEPEALRVPARRLEWPVDDEQRWRPRVRWTRWHTVAAVVVGLFALGWVLGRVDLRASGKALGNAFGAIGLGPARYDVAITSRPAGAWISVDGVEQSRRTPATLALKPGRHEIGLSLSGEGGSSHVVTGKRGEHVTLNVALWGALRVDVPPGGAPLTVTVDGLPRGYAPFVLERVQPGIHRLQFSGPGVTPWEQTVEVHVNGTAEVMAQPVVSPPTGVLEVRARLADDTGAEPLTGAAVRIDGQQRGVTPLRLELPRGPHSIRVSYRGEDSPVQVIELPGGNQRFATLDIGLDFDQPRLAAALPGRVAAGQPTVLSASLERAREGDVREMWLHVRTPEGAWRRYPMNVMKAPGGLVGVVVFPAELLRPAGRTSWYVSALATTGDEYFTEIQSAQAAAK